MNNNYFRFIVHSARLRGICIYTDCHFAHRLNKTVGLLFSLVYDLTSDLTKTNQIQGSFIRGYMR